MEIKPIAYIQTDFPTKFGLPRQSTVEELKGTIRFVKEYNNVEAVRGLEEFSHLWLLWEFSLSERDKWNATVRPPRLGGNKRVGVFATRSPFRPNPIGLSCVRLESVERTKEGAVLHVAGIDMADGTPIFDIKPYVPFSDRRDAYGGFTETTKEYSLEVKADEKVLARIDESKRNGLLYVLSQDPRPSYQEDEERVYGVEYAGVNVRFSVKDGVLTVLEIE